MRKFSSILLALGAGAALVELFKRRQRRERAACWSERRPGTALVTGASSGIGAAFTRALARQGYDLVITARREDRLRSLAQEIERQFPVRVALITADLDSPGDLARLEQRVQELNDLDVLVNNAGFGFGGYFAEIDGEAAQRMLRVMVLACMRLSRAALPGMIARRRGGIINVSSLAGFMPAAGNSVYGASKAQLNFFSEALAEELHGTGVRVQALCPGFTHTEIHDRFGRPALPAFLWLEADYVAAESLRGLREGQLYVVPGRMYRVILALAICPLLRPLTRLVQSQVMKRRRLPPG